MTETQAQRVTYVARALREHEPRAHPGPGWACICGCVGLPGRQEWHEHIALALLRANFEWSEGFYTWDECDDGGPCPRCNGTGRQYFVKPGIKR